MGAQMNSEDSKRENIAKLGEELGILFNELWNETAWLHLKWGEYVELFGTSPSRIDLLNQSAPLFFRTVQDTLWESVLLHIARLLDPPQSMGKSNLSLQRLPNLLNEEISATVSTQINDAKIKTEFCRDWRNRHIAHHDLELALGEELTPLASASRLQVKQALESIVKVLNTISEFYMESTLFFDIMSKPGSAENLIYILDDGIKAETERQND